jgi:hypothetical protein
MSKHLKRSAVIVHITNAEQKTEQRTIQFVSEGCKFFFNQQHHLLQLERGERALYDFLTEYMDKDNIFNLDDDLRSEFKNSIDTVTSLKVQFSKKSVDQYIQTLEALGLVLHSGRKGLYRVNPKFAFRGTEVARKILLKRIIETHHRRNLPLEKLVGPTEI